MCPIYALYCFKYARDRAQVLLMRELQIGLILVACFWNVLSNEY